jgi:hypothetical protein
LNETGSTRATREVRADAGRRCSGLAIRPRRRRTAVTPPTIVPAVERGPRRKREPLRGFATGVLRGAALGSTSARYALIFSTGSSPTWRL